MTGPVPSCPECLAVGVAEPVLEWDGSHWRCWCCGDAFPVAEVLFPVPEDSFRAEAG